MKKILYTTPQTDVVNIHTENLLTTTSPNPENPTNLGDVKPGGDDPGDFSRRRNLWNDED